MAVSPEVERRIRRLALQNAIEHGGTPRSGPILARLLSTDPSLRSSAGDVEAEIRRIVGEVSSLSDAERRTALSGLGGAEAAGPRAPARAEGELPPLAGAVDGHVVLRMAPFPSGGLHIGSARMIFVNDYYRRLYHGQLLLVFDDTIGSEEKRIDLELFDVIRRDLEIAGAVPDAVYYKSDRIPSFYPWARRVIELGGAYVCTCPAELLRENRAKGLACAERGQTQEASLEGWEKMLGGAYGEGTAVLRLRTDLQDPDPAFRDRVLFRISEADHPRVGHRYRVWPLLEFSWAVDDLELGISHVIRGKDLVMEDRMEQYLWNLWGRTGPPFLHWGLLRLREAKISKSKSYLEVKSGEYDGWADPRTWSIASLDRRGISPEAIRRFTLSFGLSLADIEVPAETLYAENRAIVDASTPRRAFVPDPVRVDVAGFPADLGSASLANHPDRPELGRRTVVGGPSFWLPRADLLRTAGTEVRLKDLANIRLPPGAGTSEGPVAAEFTTKENRKLPRIQWVGVEGAVPVDLLGIEGQHQRGIGEAALADAQPRDRFQFERVGFVRVEADWRAGDAPVRVVFGHP